jgi:iron complex transport system substrate-binding protein
LPFSHWKGALAVEVSESPGNRSIFVLFVLIFTLAVAGCQTREADDSDPVSDDNMTEETATEPADNGGPDTEATVAPEIDDDRSDDAGEEAVSDPTSVVDDGRVDQSDFPVTITRTDGVELTLDQQPNNIISLSPGATEIFFEIGAADQIAAVDMFSDYPPETADYPMIDAYQPDPEAIVDFEPDLVFVVYDADGIVEVLDGLGIPVLYLDAPSDLAELASQIRNLGEVTGQSENAEELATVLEERIEELSERIPDRDEKLRIYHELDETLFTVGPDSFIGDLYSVLGAENIASEAMGDYPQLSEEIILEKNPDVIILPGHGADGAVDAVRERPGWEVVRAVENDRIYEIDGDIVSRPGPRIIEALEQLAEMLYPEEFSSFYGISIGQIHFESTAAAL